MAESAAATRMPRQLWSRLLEHSRATPDKVCYNFMLLLRRVKSSHHAHTPRLLYPMRCRQPSRSAMMVALPQHGSRIGCVCLPASGCGTCPRTRHYRLTACLLRAAFLSLQELVSASAALGGSLLSSHGIKQGERVLLVYLPGLDFIVAFLACLYVGVIPVPVYPPDPRNLRVNVAMFTMVAAAAGASTALSHSAYLDAVSLAKLKDSALGLFGRAKAEWPALKWLSTDKVHAAAAAAELAPPTAWPSEQLAFLQFTSGSTSEPKGVMISHGNLSYNLEAIISALRASADTVVVSWLPQYHDMGLIGAYLGTLYCGGSGVYISPMSFIRSPMVWLRLISVHRATHVQAPNFAYALTARKYREAVARGEPLSDLNLSSLQHVFNAAEPITYTSLSDFLRTFAPLGFRAASMKPGYGLAENTVYVSEGGTLVAWANRGRVEQDALAEIAQETTLQHIQDGTVPGVLDDMRLAPFVSVGSVFPYDGSTAESHAGITVLIVRPEERTIIQEEHHIGEIWIHSASSALGYWQLDELSVDTFEASPVALPADAPAPWSALPTQRYLRTGDLAFIHKGQLFVCGRMKDLIISRGRNFFPQDIERAIEEDARLRPGCSAAFSTPAEQLVVAAEMRPTVAADQLQNVADTIRSAVMRDFGLRVHSVVLLAQHTLRKVRCSRWPHPSHSWWFAHFNLPFSHLQTTSGKVARRWNLRAFQTMDSDPSSPWHASKKAVLLRSQLAGDADATAAGPETDGIAPTEVAGVVDEGQLASLEGAELKNALVADIAALLREPVPARVPLAVSMVDLGLDSLSLTQFSSKLQHAYGFQLKDEYLFAEGATVQWLLDNAGALRTGTALPPPAGPAVPRPARQPVSQPTIDGGSAPGASTSASGPVSGDAAEGDVGADAGRVGVAAPPARNQPSALAMSCPCFLWCCGW